MITATISLNKAHRLISETLTQRYRQRYPNHKVTLELKEGSDLKPSLVLEESVVVSSSGPGDSDSVPVEFSKEAREFVYQTFIKLFIELHGKYPWDMPR